MYCQNCGKRVAETSKFCPFCGQRLAAAPAIPLPVAVPLSPAHPATKSNGKSGRRPLILLGVIAVIGVVAAAYFLLPGALGGGSGGQENAGAVASGSDTALTKSDAELAREMAMTCFLYDTNGVEQADGTLVGNWFVGGDTPNTKYKDLLIEIRQREVSRSEQANGWDYQADAYVNYLYANLDGGRWNEGEKRYTIHISAAGDAWENLEFIGRRCGLPMPESVLRATTESGNALQAIAEGIEVELAHPLSELNWKVVEDPSASAGFSYQLRISYNMTNTLDVEKRFWVLSRMESCTCVSSDRGMFWPLKGEDRQQEVVLAPHETQTITLQAPIERKQNFVSLNRVKLQIQDDDYNTSREWTFTR